MSVFTPAEVAYLESQRLARIATSGPDCQPHVVPFDPAAKQGLRRRIGKADDQSLDDERGLIERVDERAQQWRVLDHKHFFSRFGQERKRPLAG